MKKGYDKKTILNRDRSSFKSERERLLNPGRLERGMASGMQATKLKVSATEAVYSYFRRLRKFKTSFTAEYFRPANVARRVPSTKIEGI